MRQAMEMGYRLIDTAEMYGDGGAEEVVGQAVAEALRAGDVRRDELCVVSKVYPHNASRSGTVAACERSRKRLGLDQIDVYLLHWRGEPALQDTVAGMHALQQAGAIRLWGVSNFDVPDMDELAALLPANPADPSGCATNQVFYAPSERGPDFSLLPWQRERHMPLMAYSPLGQGELATDPVLAAIGTARGVTAAQVALAWVVAQPGVVAIPKAVQAAHLRANLAAASLSLSDGELGQIEARFPAPRHRTPLAMI